MSKSIILLFINGSQRAVGFALNSPHESRVQTTSQCLHHQSNTVSLSKTVLLDSLFDEIFDDENIKSNNCRQASNSHKDDAPPFSQLESDADRTRRMEMVRSLQKWYYNQNKESSESVTSSNIAPSIFRTSSNDFKYGSTTLHNVATLTSLDGVGDPVLLPGYQYIWNVHLPHHSHMFHSILSQPPPWHFVHLAIGSNSNEEKTPSDTLKAHKLLVEALRESTPVYGSLMRITDRRFQDEDGRIVVAVQALEKVRLNDIVSHSGPSSFLVTDVQLWPDVELVRTFFDDALLSSASYHSSASFGYSESGSLGPMKTSNPSAVTTAAQVAAIADSFRCRKFEYLPIYLEERPRPPSSTASKAYNEDPADFTKNNNTAPTQSSDLNGDTKYATDYLNVAQLANYDAFSYSSLQDRSIVTSQALRAYWKSIAQHQQTDNFSNDLNPTSCDDITYDLPPLSSSTHTSVEDVVMMEYHLWQSIDAMICLLSRVSPTPVPLPSQLLGLLPKRNDWGEDFSLDKYANAMNDGGANSNKIAYKVLVGTFAKSSFVRVDDITSRSSSSPPLTASSSTSPISHQSLRRAHRLSFSIWLLLEGLALTGGTQSVPTRIDVLGMSSTLLRLRAAKEVLDDINGILRRLVPKSKTD